MENKGPGGVLPGARRCQFGRKQLPCRERERRNFLYFNPSRERKGLGNCKSFTGPCTAYKAVVRSPTSDWESGAANPLRTGCLEDLTGDLGAVVVGVDADQNAALLDLLVEELRLVLR